MKARGAAIQGALAVVGLTAAYLAWQRDPAPAEGDVSILDISKKELRNLKFEHSGGFTELIPDDSGTEPSVWVRVTPAPKKTPPPGAQSAAPGVDGGTQATAAAAGVDGGTNATAAAPTATPDAGTKVASADPHGGHDHAHGEPENKPPEITEPAEYRGNTEALRLFQRFAPFYVKRVLGDFTPEQLEKMAGGDKGERTLELTTSKGPQKFRVFVSPGTGLAYLKAGENNRAYLDEGYHYNMFTSAEGTLIDRRLHTFSSNGFDRLVIQKADKQRELTATYQGDVKLNGPKGYDDPATQWHRRLFSVYPEKVLGKGQKPKQGEPKVELKVEYFKGKNSLGWVEVGTVGNETYLRTEYTPSWVQNNEAKNLIQDVDKILGTT